MNHYRKRKGTFFIVLVACMALLSVQSQASSGPSLSYEPKPYLSDDDLPSLTPPIIEIGAKFLSPGNIKPGFTLPTGAVWSPALWVFGTSRTALQVYQGAKDTDEQTQEWATRLDLFINLQLSGTERVLLGFTPLHDRDTGEFTGKIFTPDNQQESIDASNSKIDTLFFEGDFAELFPHLDYFDSTPNDIGFTIGRQNILFMDGFLINDTMDGIGLSKNNLRLKRYPWLINWRSSIFVGFDEVNRDDNQDSDDSKLFSWFNQIDTASRTVNIDLVYVDGQSTGDLFNLGMESIQRLGKLNTAFRSALSIATDDITAQSDNGLLLFMELSWVPPHTHNNVYLNAFLAIDDFTSAARGPLTGGPLGRTGILFAAQSLGSFPAPLSNSAQRAAGFSWGYQAFFSNQRRQVIVETGARLEADNDLSDELGIAIRFQQALGKRTFIQLDAYGTWVEGEDNAEVGTRIELQIKL